MRFEDLPAKDQAAWRRNARSSPTRYRDRSEDTTSMFPVWCMACGLKLCPPTDGRLDRHQRETGHTRYEAFPTDEEMDAWQNPTSS